MHRSDDRSRLKLVGPSSAAQLFAQSAPKAAISGYRAEREEAELRRAKLAKESRLNARWKRQEAAQSLQQAPLPDPEAFKERLTPTGPSKTSRKDPQPTRPRAQSVVSPPPSESASVAGSTVSQPILHSFISSAESSFGSDNSAPASLFRKDPQNSNSKINSISDLDRQKMESEQFAKAKENAFFKAVRTEEQKEQRRKKDDEKARERHKQRLTNEANKLGIELSEERLASEVEKYMIKREVCKFASGVGSFANLLLVQSDLQRRRERYPAKKISQDMPSDNLLSQAFPPSQPRAFSAVAESAADEDDITLEEQVRRARAAVPKERSLLALARNPSFARAAAKKTVADFQSDTESEEDPDPEPAPGTEKFGSGEAVQELNLAEIETDEDITDNIKGLDPDEQDAQVVPPLPDMTASFERRNRSKKPQSRTSSTMGNFISTLTNVMLYAVKKTLTFNGNKGEKVVLGQYVSQKQANDFAAAKIQELRKRQTRSISEAFDDDDLYFATVVYDPEGKNQAQIWVTATAMSPDDRPDFDPSEVEYRFPVKSWILTQYITKREVDEETGQITIHYNKPEILDQFSRLEMANHEACTRLITLLKPKSLSLEYVTQHANDLAPMIRQGMEDANADKQPVEYEIEKAENLIQWVDFDAVKMVVTLLTVKGPRN
jgi:hypothetical protein